MAEEFLEQPQFEVIYVRVRYSKCLYYPSSTCLGEKCGAACDHKLMDYRPMLRATKATKATKAPVPREGE